MDYKEKYEHALEVAQRFYNNSAAITKKGLEDIFPELRESEDEKIKKVVKDFVENYLFWEKNNLTKEKALAWLEKQGEHADFLNKIQIGDKVTRNKDGVLVNLSQLNRVAKKDEKQGEQKPMDIEDALKEEYKKGWDTALLQLPKEVDSQIWQIANNSAKTWEESFAILNATQKAYDKGKNDALKAQHNAWSEEDVAMLDSAIAFVEHSAFTTIGKGKNNVISWLKSLKDRVQPQPKQEWSDEDIERYESCLKRLGTGNPEQPETVNSKWFRQHCSPQSHWKPSDEQMDALRYVTNFDYGGHKTTLVSLYEQLKNLKG